MENRKFKILDEVVICGSYTGRGDIRAFITNYSFSKIHRSYFYHVRDSRGINFYVSERFLTRYRETAAQIIETAKREYRKNHTAAEVNAYHQSYALGCLSASYDALLEKYEKLLESYEEMKNDKEVLNPIS